jgi:hypothetical protein
MQYSNIGVFSSSSSVKTGTSAAQILYEELLREASNECFKGVFLGSARADQSVNDIFDIARHEKYDVVIICDTLGAIDGSNLSAASVLQQIRVFQVNKTDETLMLAARVEELGEPVYSRDFIFFKTGSQAASPVGSLMGNIGRQFVSVICAKPDVKANKIHEVEQADPVKE